MALFSLVRFVARGENTLYGGFSSKSAFVPKNNKNFLLECCKQQIKINVFKCNSKNMSIT